MQALQRAGQGDNPAVPWTIAWFTGLVNKQNGHLDEAIASFRSIVDTQFQDARDRGFDFSLDYRVLNELGQTLVERARLERGEARRPKRDAFLQEATTFFHRTLKIDPENVTAHFNLSRIHAQLGDEELATQHRKLHLKYKPDDNAGDQAIAKHRAANDAADHAAESIVIYDLQRAGAFGLGDDK